MTDRSEIANARPIADRAVGEGARRVARPGRQSVPAGGRGGGGGGGGGGGPRGAPDAVTVSDRARAELANMEEARIFTDRELEILGIVHPRSADRALVDAMRRLRTRLYALRPETNFSVLVSSVVPEGGGSFTALNLAATIAFDQARASLLVDANVHRPVLDRLLKLIGRERSPGLFEYLEHPELGVEHIVGPSGIPRMRVIPIGRHDAIRAEHLASARCERLMTHVKSRYDNRYVIVDGPAMTASVEARILSGICDFTVLVVPYGGVAPGTLGAIVGGLDGRRLAGIVINDQPP